MDPLQKVLKTESSYANHHRNIPVHTYSLGSLLNSERSWAHPTSSISAGHHQLTPTDLNNTATDPPDRPQSEQETSSSGAPVFLLFCASPRQKSQYRDGAVRFFSPCWVVRQRGSGPIRETERIRQRSWVRGSGSQRGSGPVEEDHSYRSGQ